MIIWGLGDWGLGPIPNPQSPIPNIIYLILKLFLNFLFILIIKKIINYTEKIIIKIKL